MLLSVDRIQAIHAAAVAADLVAHQDALLASLPQEYVSRLPSSARPDARLLLSLHAMNGVTALSDGSVPLIHWLRNAATLSATLAAQSVFTSALDELEREPALANRNGPRDGLSEKATDGAAIEHPERAIEASPLEKPRRLRVAGAWLLLAIGVVATALYALLRTQPPATPSIATPASASAPASSEAPIAKPATTQKPARQLRSRLMFCGFDEDSRRCIKCCFDGDVMGPPPKCECFH